MSKNVIKICGGLGNQLFQYAFGWSLTKINGGIILVDPVRVDHRPYQLEHFNIDYRERFIADGADESFREKKIERENLKYVREQKNHKYDKDIYCNADAYYDGFWVNYGYFDAFYEDIERQFRLNMKLSENALKYLKRMKEEKSVACHIRRTDFDREIENFCLTESFYMQAIKALESEIGKFMLFIFTDDKRFVKENFNLCNYILVEGTSDLEDFELMKSCSHHIIANSSFSYWAAYLSENKGGIVYAPVIPKEREADMYLPGWRCIVTKVGHNFK